MRIISGTAKGRKLRSIPGKTTRPILQRVRTALFDTLRPELQDTKFLDLFAGTGSVGIEALSQGAKSCTCIELDAAAYKILQENIELVGFTNRCQAFRRDAFLFLKKSQDAFDIIYIAPPQYEALWVKALHMIAERPDLVVPGGLVIVQIDPREYEALPLTEFVEEEQRRYGNTLLVFYRRNKS
jgi:16S rRNA (guanine(966)-N(2))-methyltransferase RsmD